MSAPETSREQLVREAIAALRSNAAAHSGSDSARARLSYDPGNAHAHSELAPAGDAGEDSNAQAAHSDGNAHAHAEPAPAGHSGEGSNAEAAHSSNDSARMIAALKATALLLCDAREPIAIALRHELQSETGLSLPMIEWGLLTSLSSLRHAPLAELAATRPADALSELIGVVLAGNVFVAALRGIALPLLAGAHVIAKTASREGAFARAFHAALKQADPEMAARLAIVQFPREDEAATRALCTSVDALSVYGSDETVEQLRHLSEPRHAQRTQDPNAQRTQDPNAQRTQDPNAQRTHETSAQRTHDANAQLAATTAPRIIAHGHGLSAACVAQSALQSIEQATHTAERVALDVSAYDQHGCLSPHFVLVEPGAPVDPETFAQLLAANALPALAQLLPPAAATLDEQAQRMQWEATAAIRGELHSHASHAVSFEPAPLRPSPGGRLVSVYTAKPQALRELLAPFAEHLKSVGVAGNKAERTALTEQLQAFTTAQVCRSGEMQTPAFDAWADGAPPLAGLFRRR